jgi:hypothetical protein
MLLIEMCILYAKWKYQINKNGWVETRKEEKHALRSTLQCVKKNAMIGNDMSNPDLGGNTPFIDLKCSENMWRDLGGHANSQDLEGAWWR